MRRALGGVAGLAILGCGGALAGRLAGRKTGCDEDKGEKGVFHKGNQYAVTRKIIKRD